MSAMPSSNTARFQWVKPGIWGAVIGAAAISIVGFSAFGWTTGGNAERLAAVRANAAVTAALTPVCVAQAQADPERDNKLAQLASMTSSNQRRQFVTEAGWATLPGASAPDRAVATSCASALTEPPPA